MYCKSIIINSVKGTCVYQGGGETNCSVSSCEDVLLNTKEVCLANSNTCFWNPNVKKCKTINYDCEIYYIPN